MKILNVTSLEIPEVKVINYARFKDERGYFTETFRKSDFQRLDFIKDSEFFQLNESLSRKGTIRGMHFQWNPYMSKLVRVIQGSIVDLFLDIRRGSPTFGKIGGHRMTADSRLDQNTWIWVPSGFAHGIVSLEETILEYFCTSEWNPECETSISPLAPDIDWSLCPTELKQQFDIYAEKKEFVSAKDLAGKTLGVWQSSSESKNFIYEGYEHTG